MNYDNFVTKEQILTLVRSQPRKIIFREGLSYKAVSGKEYCLEVIDYIMCQGLPRPYYVAVEAQTRNKRISLLELLSKCENLKIEHLVDEDTEKQIVFQGYTRDEMRNPQLPCPDFPNPNYFIPQY